MRVTQLKCRACGALAEAKANYVCAECFGPMGCVLDEAAIRRTFTKSSFADRPKSIWRYHEVLPVAEPGKIGPSSGFTPLVRADRLAKKLGVGELWIKDDSVNHPTCSYKDRAASFRHAPIKVSPSVRHSPHRGVFPTTGRRTRAKKLVKKRGVERRASRSTGNSEAAIKPRSPPKDCPTMETDPAFRRNSSKARVTS